jgi:hypothetical protein
MKFNAQQYFGTATERIKQARILYGHDDSYALAMYTAGVAVECMFRAFKLKRTPVFDERHDLLRLFKESGILELNEDPMVARGIARERAVEYSRKIRAAVNDVYRLWANDYRYASEGRLRSELIQMKQYPRLKGDVLKASACQLLNAAEVLVERGAVIWANSRKN